MGGYIGATAVGLTTTAADVQGDITSTDTTPELILKNTSEEDTEGGREGKITFKGEQSGGEESTLAQIESAHDGTSDDQKGDLIFKTNDGSDGASPTEAMRIDSAGRLGIGVSPSAWRSGQKVLMAGNSAFSNFNNISTNFTHNVFHDGSSNKYVTTGEEAYQINLDSFENAIRFQVAASGTAGNAITFTEAMRIDTDGNIGMGTSSPSLGSSGKGLHLKGPSGNATVLKIDSTTTSQEAQLQFTVDGTDKHRIASDTNGILEFVRSGVAVHGRFLPEGALQVSNNGVFDTWSNNITSNQIRNNNTGLVTLTVDAFNSSFANDVQRLLSDRSNSSSYDFLVCTSGNLGDDEFRLRGDGNAFADGTWTAGGADYAEYFEWADGNTDNEDRVGFSVVLDNNKIRKATSSDDAENIIGVISENPSVVGDGDMDAWKHKYLRDDFGRYIKDTHKVVEWTETVTENEETKEVQHSYEDWNIPDDVSVPSDATFLDKDENGNVFNHKRLNPDYDPDRAYVRREDRPEWVTVGMMGKLRMRKGQPTGDRWIKMRDVSDTVEEWLVR
tara:strand:+ start:859 stop:2535 length:1677 start_codon:yes stop_codon:yes gene_type:complete